MDNTNRLESKFAKRYGGQAVKNSGRGETKGDAVIENLLIDFKFTDAKSFSIAIEAFKKHERDAHRVGMVPAVVPVFMQQNERALAVVDLDWLYDILIEMKDLEADLADANEVIRGFND